MSDYQVVHGEVEAVLSTLPDNVFDGVLCDPPYGLSFMGKRWDYQVPQASLWAQVLRVCKPGAALIAFSGTRTYHRSVVQIEDAGWEIRDQLAWMYGTGFPKSLNLDGTHVGYGTALKPAFEPAVLARKPLEGTVAQNVARWGCGALAIDACRIYTDWSERPDSWKASGHSAKPDASKIAAPPGEGIVCNPLGRWPANLMMDEAAGAVLDAQTGILTSGKAKAFTGGPHVSHAMGTKINIINPATIHADSGGASRFFYCTKASRKERDLGCESLAAKTAGEATDRQDGTEGLENPRAGAGRTGGAKNHHPTVKPLALMEYLSKLILPPQGGALLVPFAGSGSEMIGALRGGWSAVVGIEMEEEYVHIANLRLKHYGL